MIKYWNPTPKRLWLAEHFFLILPLIYMSMMYIPAIRPVYVIAPLLFFLYSSIYSSSVYNIKLSIFFAFFVYVVFSIQGYIYNEIPISVYVQSSISQLLPMLFFLFPFADTFDKEKFYRLYIVGISFAMLVGLYLYYFPTSRYLSYISIIGASSYETNMEAGFFLRFQSFFGSTVTGSLAVILVILSLYEINCKDGKLYDKLFYVIALLLGLISSLLTLQRSAMVGAIMVLFAYLVWMKLFQIKMSKLYMFVNSGIILFVLYKASSTFEAEFSAITERFDDANISAFDDRDLQWRRTFSHSKNLLIGTGMGSAGSSAGVFTKYIIPDGAIFRMIAEYGVAGLVIFINMIFKCFIYNIKNAKYLVRELMIVGIVLFQSTGSDTLNFQSVAFMFWFAMGVLANYKQTNTYFIWK